MKLVLHNYWRSSASHRTRTALALKQLEFEYVAVNLRSDDQHSDAYRAKNPMRQVPTLEITEDDGTMIRLTQSIAIIEYLEERFPDPPLLPRDRYLRARVRQLSEIVNSGIQPLQNQNTARKVKQFGGDDRAWQREFVATGLAAFAAAAADVAGQFCVGDVPTVADCCLIPQLYSARRFGSEIASLTQLLAIEQRCLALPAFARAMPDQQPDAVRS